MQNICDEEYYKDQNLLEADRLEEERKLWQWIEDNPIVNVVKDVAVEGKKSYLYNSDNEQIDPEFQLSI